MKFILFSNILLLFLCERCQQGEASLKCQVFNRTITDVALYLLRKVITCETTWNYYFPCAFLMDNSYSWNNYFSHPLILSSCLVVHTGCSRKHKEQSCIGLNSLLFHAWMMDCSQWFPDCSHFFPEHLRLRSQKNTHMTGPPRKAENFVLFYYVCFKASNTTRAIHNSPTVWDSEKTNCLETWLKWINCILVST